MEVMVEANIIGKLTIWSHRTKRKYMFVKSNVTRNDTLICWCNDDQSPYNFLMMTNIHSEYLKSQVIAKNQKPWNLSLAH